METAKERAAYYIRRYGADTFRGDKDELPLSVMEEIGSEIEKEGKSPLLFELNCQAYGVGARYRGMGDYKKWSAADLEGVRQLCAIDGTIAIDDMIIQAAPDGRLFVAFWEGLTFYQDIIGKTPLIGIGN